MLRAAAFMLCWWCQVRLASDRVRCWRPQRHREASVRTLFFCRCSRARFCVASHRQSRTVHWFLCWKTIWCVDRCWRNTWYKYKTLKYVYDNSLLIKLDQLHVTWIKRIKAKIRQREISSFFLNSECLIRDFSRYLRCYCSMVMPLTFCMVDWAM